MKLNILAFLCKEPGKFFKTRKACHSRENGACHSREGGNLVNISGSPFSRG